MKAIRIHEHGGPEVLKLDDIPSPKLQADEVLIRVKTAGMNHLDIWVRKGIPGVPLPMIMGSDAAGVIEEVGSLVQGDFTFQQGDEVLHTPIRSCGHCRFCEQGQENLCRRFHIPGESVPGVQAQWIAVPARYVLPKPQSLNWAEAAALPLASMTAYHMLLNKVGLSYGQTILIYGASGGVGSSAIQIAKALGAQVITTAGDTLKAKKAKSLGADFVIDYKQQDVGRTVRELTEGRGVDVVFEHTGQQTWNDSLRALRKGGKLVTCGATTGPVVKIDLRNLFIKHQQLIGSTMGTRHDLRAILQMTESGHLKPPVGRIFPFSQVKEAHRYLEEGRHFGKVVLSFE